jgi:transposase
MAEAKSLVGLDVHATTTVVAAVLDADTGQLQTFSMDGDAAGAAGFCAGLPRPVRVAYEAGPMGYGLARELIKRRVECVVAAPSKIPRASGDRMKTDRRDAAHLVRLLLAGKLHSVRVPGDEEEHCATWSALVTRCGWISCVPVIGCQSCCCVTGSGLMTTGVD